MSRYSMMICSALLCGPVLSELAKGMPSSASPEQRRLGVGGDEAKVDCGDPYHSHWDYNNDQYCFVECMVLLPMILLAVIFDEIHHRAHHKVQQKAKVHVSKLNLGKKEIIEKGHIPGLYSIRLFDRSSDEFMVLGFIAFCVWCCNKGSVFQKVVRPYDSDKRTGVGTPYNSYGPPSGSELLHLVEDVHMQLFIAMVLYFVFMVAAVRYIEKCIAIWIDYEKQLRAMGYPVKVDGTMNSMFARVLGGKMMSLHSYHAVREYFISWLQTKSKKIARSRETASGKVQDSNGVDFNLGNLNGFGRDFDFSTYLIVHVDEIMDDLLTIQGSTWGFVAGVFGILGIIARTAYEGEGKHFDKLSFIIAVLFVCIEVCILFRVEIQYKRDVDHKSVKQQTIRHLHQQGLEMDGASDSASGGAGAGHSEQQMASVETLTKVHSFAHSAEMVLLRILQAILLYSCFFCARFIGSPNVWLMATAKYTKIYGIPQWAKALVVSAIIFSTICTLPVLISELNLMFRLPPFVDRSEEIVVQAICDEQPSYIEDRLGRMGSGESQKQKPQAPEGPAVNLKSNQVQPVSVGPDPTASSLTIEGIE